MSEDYLPQSPARRRTDAADRLYPPHSRPVPLPGAPLDPAVAAALLPSMTRLAVAVTGVTGSPDIRRRLELAQAGKLQEGDAAALGADLDLLAVLLTRR